MTMRKESWRSPSFYAWLTRQVDRDEPIGDLARDVVDDRDFPRGLHTLPELLDHLRFKRADTCVQEVAEEAWDAFRLECR